MQSKGIPTEKAAVQRRKKGGGYGDNHLKKKSKGNLYNLYEGYTLLTCFLRIVLYSCNLRFTLKEKNLTKVAVKEGI